MLEIRTIRDSVVVGGKIRLDALGGVPPYTFTLVGSGDGGSIANGFYIAPFSAAQGLQEVQVQDNSGATATKAIYISDHLQLIAAIIREEMALSADQVFLYNEKYTIPKDSRIYVVIGYQGIKTIGNNERFNDGFSAQYISSQAQISIDIMSKSFDVLARKDEVILALNSQLSKTVQYVNGFKIASVPVSMNDVSGIDGTLIPYRFNATINIHYTKSKVQEVGFFDTFRTTVFPENAPSVEVDLRTDVALLLLEDGGLFLLENDQGFII